MSLFLAFVLVIVIDQLTKYFVVTHFALGESVPVIEGVFHWTYILNPGAAFGMLEGSRWLFVVIALAVIGGIWFCRRAIHKEGPMTEWGAALFAGGAVGNLIDRTLHGLVIDFFDFRIWPVFNVADIAICVGVGMILWNTIRMELLTKKS